MGVGKGMIPRTLLKSHNLEQVTLEEGRHYLDVDGNKYTSVTTLLSQLTDSSFLEKWVNRVGVPESERIRGTANKRGTAVHDAVERYLNNDQDYLRDATLIDHDAINKLIEAINQNVSHIFGIEHQMYSKELKAAGTTDQLSVWKNKLAIIDYKTSKKWKKTEWVQNHLLQGAAYSIMAKELHNLDVTDIVVLIAVDHEPLQIIHEKAPEYQAKVRALFSQQ